jgi:hypothetical protein
MAVASPQLHEKSSRISISFDFKFIDFKLFVLWLLLSKNPPIIYSLKFYKIAV